MIDYGIVALYLIITLFVGLYVGRNVKNIRDFAIGQRNFSTTVLVSAVFASVVDASGTVGLAGNTFTIGPIFVMSYLGIVLSRFGIAYFIAPRMWPFLGLISSGDIFEKIYGRRAKTLMGVSTIIESTLTAGAQVLAISHIVQYFYGVSVEIAAIGASIVIIAYSFRGGIKSVTATDVFQFAILIIAIPILCGIAIYHVGGYESLVRNIQTNGLFFTSAPSRDMGHQIAIFFSFAIPCLYPLCIQRLLMAKSPEQIRSTFIINGFLSLPFYIAVGLIGISAHFLYPEIDPNFALPKLVSEILPVGVKGFVIAGLLAIFMSTIDSILNIGAIAVTHDFIGSLLSKPLSNKTEMILVRISSVVIALGAISITLWFNNVLHVIFFIMVIGNSVFFPGYMLGIIGLNGSQKAFWIGVLSGVSTVIVCIFIFDTYFLYAMLLGIGANSSIHLIQRWLVKKEIYYPTKLLPSLEAKAIFSSNTWVKNQDYCSIFAICGIGISLFPFFGAQNAVTNQSTSLFLTLNALNAILLFSVIFRELWWGKLARFFPLIWAISIILTLPVQAVFMFIKTDFSLVWLTDALVIMPLLSMITSRKGAMASFVVGALGASIMALFVPHEPISVSSNFGYWAIFTHIIVLAICLTIFRKRDVEICRSTSSILIHEANRSLSTFENAASYYEEFLPRIISAYKEHVPSEKRDVASQDLEEILQLPTALKEMGHGTKRALSGLFDRVSYYSSVRQFNKLCDVPNCIDLAINNHIFNFEKIPVKINKNNALQIAGDQDQLTQVFINLTENAIHALKNTKNPQIEISINQRMVTFRDNGEGISANNLPNVFEEFFSTKSTTGQGLAYCKHVLNEHGATITCTSKRGLFTEFNILFPT